MKRRNWYSLDGELWSGCIHMTPIDRETARRYIKRHGGKLERRRHHGPRSSVSFTLNITTSARIAKGYRYRTVRVGITRG
jgi:hypothetical protein